MLNEIPIRVMKRKRQRSIAISDEMFNEIKNITEDCISVSGFIRIAILKEIEKYKKESRL